MKKILLSVFALFAFAGSGFSQNLPSYVPANGLVGWWPFNGNANDESGNGQNAVYNTANLSSDRFGNSQKAYYFNGISDSISFGNIHTLDSASAFSASVWFKYSSTPTFPNDWYHIICDGSYADIDGWGIIINSNQIAIRELDNINGMVLNYPIGINQWHHLVSTCGPDSTFFYFNGTKIGARKNYQIQLTLNTTNSLLLGCGTIKNVPAGSNPYFFNGTLDDIAIYNRALSQQEITALYQGANTNTNCPTFPASLAQGLVGYWPFCGNALDESGNGNHGTVNGATLTTDRFGNLGSAYSFDGVNDFIQIPDNTSLDIQDSITISIWVKTSNTPPQFPSQSMRLVDKATGGTGDSYMLDLFQTDKVRFLVGNNGANTLPSTINYSEDLYNVVATHNGASAKIYINGVLNSETAISGQTPANSNPLRFGADSFLSGAFFKGSLDDIAIWNRALSQNEITQLYNQGICQTSITVTDTLLIHTGITSYNPVAYGNTLKVWPNPGNQDITLDAGNLSLMQGWKIKISNSLGQEVYPAALISQQQQVLDMSAWGGNGLYLLHLINPQGHITEVKKIVLAP